MNRWRSLWLVLAMGWLPGTAYAAPCFSATQLAQLGTAQTNTLIYVWSPHMVLSALQANSIKDATMAEGLTFTPVHDARVNQTEIDQSLTKLPPSAQTALASSQPLCSDTLEAHQALRHFPSGFVVRGGALDTLPIVGAMPAKAWQQAIHDKLFAQCIAPNEFIPLPTSLAGTQTDDYGHTAIALGSYERVSPDGRFILRSFSGARIGDVSLIEFSPALPTRHTNILKIYETPLANEAFPVQGTWRYIVSVAGEHYAFQDLLTHEKHAKPLFQGGMTGFYAAAAELPSADASPDHVRIRSFSWPNPTGDEDNQGIGGLSVRTLTVNTQHHQIVADTQTQSICSEHLSTDGPRYALPMISVDGEEFAALPQTPLKGPQTMRIYGFGASGHDCESHASFDFASGKTIFGFSSLDQPANLAYEYQGQIWWFNRSLHLPLNMAPYWDATSSIRHVQANAFPGITRDERIVYAATWERCDASHCDLEAGYIVSDPYQSNAYRQYMLGKKLTPLKVCITYADVEQQRLTFARFHHFAN